MERAFAEQAHGKAAPGDGLSPAAHAALEREVRAVLAADRTHPSTDSPRHRTHARAARHHFRLTTAVVDARILVVPVALMFVVVALIASVGSLYVVAGVAFAAMVAGVALVAELIASMTREVEHVSPETAALLEHEGIADPDRLFGDLLAARRGITI